MCMCGKPTVNGEPGYSWDGRMVGIYPPNPPPLEDGDELLHDLPGRCGGLDSHSHHFRLVRRCGRVDLLVRHGGGDVRISLGSRAGLTDLVGPGSSWRMSDETRYWLLQMLYHVQSDAASEARDAERKVWRVAAAEKRVKTRRLRDGVKVWIEPRVETAAA